MSAVRVRSVLGLARIEAMQLLRSVLVLVGMLTGGLVVWVFVHGSMPMWWNGGWVIGYGQVVLSVTVLIAAQLATARARRDGMGELYDSFPSSAARRTSRTNLAWWVRYPPPWCWPAPAPSCSRCGRSRDA